MQPSYGQTAQRAMATIYDGPPDLKIYQEFVPSATSTSPDQNVVVVAPQYDVYNHEDESAEYTGFSTGTAFSKSWSGSVDYSNAKLYCKDAACAMGTQTVNLTETNGNVLDFGSVDVTSVNSTTGIYESAEVGDTVYVTGGSVPVTAKITAITRSSTDASYGDFTKVGGTSTGSFKIDTTSSYEGRSNCYYYLKIDNTVDFDASNSDSSEEGLTCILTTSDGSDSGIIYFSGKSASVSLGSSGLLVELDTDDGAAYSKGDYFQVQVSASGAGKLSLVHLDKAVTAATITNLSASICKYRNFYLDASQYTSTASGISTGSSITQTVTFGIASPLEYSSEVITADINVEYRQLNTKYINRLGYVEYTDDLSVIGKSVVDNPLGIMVMTALKGGAGVYFVGVSSDSVESYRKAFQVISKSSTAYAVTVASTRPDVISEAMTFVSAQAEPSVANYKILYYGVPSDTEKEILAKSESKEYVTGTIADGVVTLTTADASFIASGVLAGDTLRINYRKESDGSYSYDSYTIEAVNSATQITLNNTSVNFPVDMKFEIWRTLDGDALVDYYKSKVYTTSHRAYAVFGDGITVDGVEDAPAWLLAALPAGMRAGEYCQRPISNLTYDGCTADPKVNLSAAQRYNLASRGVWILANNDDGSQVYNYHQLSTDMSDKKLQEQSYTTNFDNISFGAKALFAPYYGNSNISEEFLNQMEANLTAFLMGKQSNAPSITVGPQLISYSNLTITQDSVNRDHVYMEVDYEMPAPFNHVVLRQRLI